MAAGKELLESYIPKKVHAGDYPVVTDSGTVAEGEIITELTPVTLDTNGKIKAVTADTITNIYGLAAEDAQAGEEIVLYLTGQFFGESINAPSGSSASDFKEPLRKLGIFLVDTDNAVVINSSVDTQTTE